MTNPDISLIAALLDRSGSMEAIADDTRGGFDAYIAGRRNEPGTALVTLAQFANEYDVVYVNRPIDDVPRLTLQPRGMTAGHENASGKWTKEAVRELISQQEKVYDWDFVFLGANMDAIDVGTGLGFAPGKSLTYAASPDGVGGAFSAMSSYTSRKRSRGDRPAASVVFYDAERQGAQGG